MTTTSLPLNEIQGLLAAGYGRQQAMCGVLLKIADAQAARGWLAQLVSQISFCANKELPTKVNVALTHTGLLRLSDPAELQGFAREFQEGMVTPHRQRVLGDLPGSPSDPGGWKWGGPANDPVDLLLLVYASDATALEGQLVGIREQFRGVEPISELRSTALKDHKEHFGFRDGIAQPWVDGLHRSGPARDRLAAGEFVLGYDDNSGVPEPAPELAINGSFLVFRQIVQRVPEFWNAFPGVSDEEKVRRAAMKMGRWPDGTPLALSPDKPDPRVSLNDFDYAQIDPAGIRCPLGSHVRRANPRDALLPNPQQSLAAVNRHRILRRGRAFGLPAAPEVYPGELEVRSDDTVGDRDLRGLFFICLNASLSRQFEFCQQSWLNNPKFLDLSDETDPIASPLQWSQPGQEPVLTAQARPVRFRVVEVEKYAHTIGGGYFFLPSRSALRRLSKTGEEANGR